MYAHLYINNSDKKFKMDGKTNASTGNLNKHLKNHLDKIDPNIEKQASFMKKFLESNKEKQPVNNLYLYYYYYVYIFIIF